MCAGCELTEGYIRACSKLAGSVSELSQVSGFLQDNLGSPFPQQSHYLLFFMRLDEISALTLDHLL